MSITERLAPYGRPVCAICGRPKEHGYRNQVRSESVFAGERYQLTCRNHPGHPLFRVGPTRKEDKFRPRRPDLRTAS